MNGLLIGEFFFEVMSRDVDEIDDDEINFECNIVVNEDVSFFI